MILKIRIAIAALFLIVIGLLYLLYLMGAFEKEMYIDPAYGNIVGRKFSTCKEKQYWEDVQYYAHHPEDDPCMKVYDPYLRERYRFQGWLGRK